MTEKLIRAAAVFLLLCLAAPAMAAGEILVIANNSRSGSLDRSVLEAVYSGQKRQISNGWRVELLDQGSSDLREKFYNALLGKDLPSMQAFWAELVFSGRAKAPKIMADDQAVMNFVDTNPNALGYVSGQAKLGSGVVVVYRLVLP